MSKRSTALCVVVLAAVMDLTDSTIVNIVLPVIQRDLDAGDGTAAAIATAYTVALASLLVTGGRLGDLMGYRRMLAVGTVAFAAASVLCAAAPSAAWLVAARAMQGAASAVLVPQTLATIQRLYPTDERGRALGVFSAAAGAATVGGPLLGALITQADVFGLGWRAVFASNVPLSVVILAGLGLIPRDGRARTGSLDTTSSGLLAVGLALLVAPCLWGADTGWPWWKLVALAGAATTLAAFTFGQRRRAREGQPLVVDPRLLRFDSFRGALLVTALVYASVFALFLTLSLHLQGHLGFSPTRAALVVLPWAVGIPLTSTWAAPRLVGRFGRRVLETGIVLMVAGLAALTWELGAGEPGFGVLVPALLTAGCGMGLVVAPLLGLGLADVPTERAGSASGVFSNAQHVGGAVGIGVLGGLYTAVGGGHHAMLSVLAGVLVMLVCALIPARLLPATREH